MRDLTAQPETWRSVVGFEGSYEVSNLGRVRSLDRALLTLHPSGKTVPRRLRGRVMSPAPNTFGHLTVQLGRGMTRHVHRLVAEAFVGPCPPGMECCHNNGDPSDNRPSNLRWDTHGGNMRDRAEHGTDPMLNKTACPRGHLLVAPNLRADTLLKGGRGCKACNRGKAHLRNVRTRSGVVLDMQAVSDAYYATIMGQPAA